MFSPPPSHIQPGSLFRLAVRGEAPLAYRVSVAPDLPLRVRAPSSLLTVEAHALARSGSLADLQALLLPAVLLTPSGPAFATAEQAGLLSDHDGNRLWAEVWSVLTCMAPMCAMHWSEWYAALRKGSESPENAHLAISLGRCVDIGRFVTPRPERFYGKPTIELSDAQYLAWRVCADAYVESLK